jgi:hypothetical protein
MEDSRQERPVVLIVTPEFELYSLYKRHLGDHGFAGAYADTESSMHEQLSIYSPCGILIEIDRYPQAHKRIGDVLNRHPSLKIITVGRHTDAETLKRWLGAGASGHVNRAITRPRDVGFIFKALF